MMKMFLKMLNWKIAVDYDFKISTENSSKYLKRYLSAEDMRRFAGIFPNGDYADIWTKLFLVYDFFAENAEYVATHPEPTILPPSRFIGDVIIMLFHTFYWIFCSYSPILAILSEVFKFFRTKIKPQYNIYA